MCGIVGYIGKQNAVPILMEGLEKLAYRGYDSAGISFVQSGKPAVVKAVGKLVNLESIVEGQGYFSQSGVGHTRWATHGKPTELNAHPHIAGSINVVHNGIIENFIQLKERLQESGIAFNSTTDTEVIAHLVNAQIKNGSSLLDAVRMMVQDIKGAYAVCIYSTDEPNRLICIKNGCPLIIGVGDGEFFVGSDIPAFLSHTRDVIYLKDEEIASIELGREPDFYKFDGQPVINKTVRIEWSATVAEKDGFKHFMAKEIHEQVAAISKTAEDRINLETGEVTLPELDGIDLKGVNRILITACGTSWHAALVGKFMIEDIARVMVEVDIASEFRYRKPIINKQDLVIVISQSGETADTLAALQQSVSLGAKVVAICNVMGSAIARASNGVILTKAGPEIGVASTKAFTTQLAALLLFAVKFGRIKGSFDDPAAKGILANFHNIPHLLQKVMNGENEIQEIAKRYFKYRDFLFLGRGINYPIALEGALKLKEISYIHAEGYPAGEMKHGPIALIDENMPVVVMAPDDIVFEKVLNNIMEVKARGGKVIAIVNDDEKRLNDYADEIIRIPLASKSLSPFLMVVPLQMLAYHIAVLRGCDVDQPRNLAKSVTVE